MWRREIPPADGAAEAEIETAPPDFVRDAIAAIALTDESQSGIPPLAEAAPDVWATVFAGGDETPSAGRLSRRSARAKAKATASLTAEVPGRAKRGRRGDRKAAARLARLSAAELDLDSEAGDDAAAPIVVAVSSHSDVVHDRDPEPFAGIRAAEQPDAAADVHPTEPIPAVVVDPLRDEPDDLHPTGPVGTDGPVSGDTSLDRATVDVAVEMPAEVDEPDPPDPGAGAYSRRSPGPRVLARKRARRRARLRVAGTFGVLALCAGALFGAWQLLPRGGSEASGQPDAAATIPSAAAAFTTDRVGVAITNEAGRATNVVTFGVDPAGEGYGLVLPGATLVDIPGAGFEPIERTPEFGGADLLRVSLENFFGIPIAGAAVFEPDLVAALAGEGVRLTVPAEITEQGDDGTLQVLFAPGMQVMDGETFMRYLTYSGDGQVLQAGRVQTAFAALFAGGFPVEAIENFAILPDLIPALGQPEFTLLPVEPRGIEGQEEIFEADRDGIQEILERKAPQTVAGESAVDRVRVEVLNGNGAVGITAPVSEQLVELGYQVVLTDNADRFDYPDTHITIYEEALVDRGREIRELLGVGQVILSRAAPSYVDITVLLGDDLGATPLESTGAGVGAG